MSPLCSTDSHYTLDNVVRCSLSVRVGFDRWNIGVMPYDQTFKMHRKLLRKTIGTPTSLLKSEHLKELETRRFLLRVLERPDELMGHLQA